MLEGKKIVLGVSGGIAIYKVVDLVSKLRKRGAGMPVPVVAIARQDTRRSAAFAGRRHRRAFFIVSIQDLSGCGGDLQRFCSK